MKLNHDLIITASDRTNPIKDRELILRGYKIGKVENLGIVRDQYDTIDFTDNDILVLDNFPPSKRLKHLMCSNNRITRIDHELPRYVPNLTTLILTNNQLSDFFELESLIGCPKLQTLSLIDNPVYLKKHYRLYVIHKFPSLRTLDFRKVRDKERKQASKLFNSPEGKQLEVAVADAQASRQSTISADSVNKKAPTPYQAPSAEEAARIKEAIKQAKTLDEIAELENRLKGGQGSSSS